MRVVESEKRPSVVSLLIMAALKLRDMEASTVICWCGLKAHLILMNSVNEYSLRKTRNLDGVIGTNVPQNLEEDVDVPSNHCHPLSYPVHLS